MTENNQPLVSIIVITYNSSKYVLETLESAKAQTYKNIELIISDDASKDNTIEICQEWLDNNKRLFVSTKLITTNENSGIPSNCNRGLNAASGNWVKLIAGDDLLKKECIFEFVNFCSQNPSARFIASNMEVLKNDKISGKIFLDPFLINGDSKHQLIMLCRFHIFLPGPSLFYHKETYLSMGGYDERFRLVEDYPMIFKVLRADFKFYHLGKELVIHREHEESISRGTTNKLADTFCDFFNLETHPFLKDNFKTLHRHFRLDNELIKFKRFTIAHFLVSTKIRLTDPFYWYFKYQAFFKGRKKWNTAIKVNFN
jgi:glycosyltransferase involved in cell wall biosynthesis